MARELWLMRHAKAERFDGLEDYDRNLKKRGKQAAKRVGQWLKDEQLLPDKIISSPALRAIGTARLVCDQVGYDRELIQQDKRIYDEGIVRVKSVLADCPAECRKVLVVGHNPELEYLLAFLVGSANLPIVAKLFPTAALARLLLPDNWSQLDRDSAELIAMVYPKVLFKEDNRVKTEDDELS